MNNEAVFTKKLSQSGNSKVIVVPPDILEYLDAHLEDTFEIRIKKL
jgi:antitoxin component of MazEF toxin-antitoxin module